MDAVMETEDSDILLPSIDVLEGHLSYRPGAEGYEDAKKHFETGLTS